MWACIVPSVSLLSAVGAALFCSVEPGLLLDMILWPRTIFHTLLRLHDYILSLLWLRRQLKKFC
jgi:hypothetical protein